MQQNKALIHDLTNKDKLLYNFMYKRYSIILTHATRQRIKIIGISLFYFKIKSVLYFVFCVGNVLLYFKLFSYHIKFIIFINDKLIELMI